MIQKPRKNNNLKKLNDKIVKNGITVADDIVMPTQYNNEKITSERIHKNNYKWITERIDERALVNYSVLYQKLKEVQIKGVHEFAEMIDDRNVPYEIPAMYSLEREKEALLIIKERMNIIGRHFCGTDVESIALDFKQIGGDLNGAICKYRECYAEKD